MTSTRDEVARRRTFAIISHPDAGKTTLTEKLAYFNLLTPEEQMASAESFAQAAEAAGALADERMANAIDNLESVTEKFLTDVKEVFLSVGVKMDGAADKQVAAANTPQTINVAVEVSPPGAGNAYVFSEP